MFFTRARDEIFAALNTLDPESGLRAKENVPSTPNTGDCYVDPNITAELDSASGQFTLQCSVIVILPTDWNAAYLKVDEWGTPIWDVLSSVLYVQRLNTVQLEVGSTTRPALVLTGVRE